MTEQTNETIRKSFSMPIEFFLGTALGFLAAGCLVVTSYGWGLGAPHILCAIILLFTVAGMVIGIIRRKIFATFRKTRQPIGPQRKYFWRYYILLSLVFALLPYALAKCYYITLALNTPIPPGWKRAELKTEVLGWDNGAGYWVKLEGDGNVKEALKYYRTYLENNGWRDGKHDINKSYRRGYSYLYVKNRTRVGIGVHNLNYQSLYGPVTGPIYFHYMN